MSKKMTYEYIKKYIEDVEGYKLLSEEYINNRTKLQIQCPNNHINNITWGSFKRGSRCKKCADEATRKRLTHNYEYVNQYITSFGFALLEPNYIHQHNDITLCCHKGHVFTTTFFKFKHNEHKSCPVCIGKPNYEYVKGEIDKSGYILLESEYKGSGVKMKVMCNNNHIYEVSWDSFKQGHRCPKCNFEKHRRSGGNNWKGGITPLYNYLRDKIGEWKYDSLKAYDFKCGITGIKIKDLIVHHLYAFNKILEELVSNLNIVLYDNVSKYNTDILLNLEKGILQKHYDYGYGIPLLPSIHSLFHDLYGQGNNTPEQFEEFKTRLRLGEFDDFLKENNFKLII